jgi:hypothetical protein
MKRKRTLLPRPLHKFWDALWRILTGTWRHLMNGTKSDYLLPCLMIGYFVVEAVLAVILRDVSWVTFAVVCFIGALAQVTVIYVRRDANRQRELRKSDEIFFTAQSRELVDKVDEYKEHAHKTHALLVSTTEKLEHAERRYEELMHARTEDIIAEINRRLSDDEPVQHVFPDVPAAPQAPPEMNPDPPF